MSANPTRVDWEAPRTPEGAFPLQEGNRVLEALARQEALPSLLAFSDLHERIRRRRAEGPVSESDRDLFQTEQFVLDEVLQLICDRGLRITHADGVLVALMEKSELICRVAAGPLAVQRGLQMPRESEFLQDCMDSGRILRCDDCDVDVRADLDLSRQIGGRSTVMVPLRGQRSRLGVLQAFSNVPFAFSDDDIRSLDLLAELILSALRPEDEDRRLNWLASVMDEVLLRKPSPVAEPIEAKAIRVVSDFREPAPAILPEAIALSEAIPAPIEGDLAAVSSLANTIEVTDEDLPPPLFLASATTARTLHPGLNVVLGLVAVAALFSAGVWFGIRHREAATKTPAAASTPTPDVVQPIPVASTTAALPDHLMDPKTDSTAPAISIAENKLSVMPKITGIRHWATPMGSTVVIDMQDQVPYEVHRLMSPERIYFDLHDTALVPDLEGKSIPVGDISLTRVRVAQPVSGVTRVVLDTRDGSNFSVSMESNPYRLVVELRTPDRSLMASNQSATHTQPTTALPLQPQDEQLRAKGGRLRVALDAGHGGWDLGTAGRKGLLEKDLVLDVTKRLGKLLQARLGSEVIFTRTNDSYVPLDERADFANQAQADLFVSVHANYSSSASARGVETYYTNSFLPPGSKEIETRESGAPPQPTQVSLSASELRGKIEESRLLAASIQKSLYNTLAANSSGIRDRGVKDSQFLVLTGTTMPAILTEISFVSSPADERKLQSAEYRQQIAEALYKGIARYESASRHVKLAEARPNSVRQ